MNTHADEHESKSHSHQDHHEHMIQDFKKRFYISLVFSIPIIVFSPMLQSFVGVNFRFQGDMYIVFALATIVFFYGGWPFLTDGWQELKDRQPAMMMLISLALILAYGYSSAVVFFLGGHEFFWELATLVLIMLLGHWIEMRSIMGASNALESLMSLLPNSAHLIGEDGNIEDVKIDDIKVDDTILVRPGENIPLDGTITKGQSDVDEAMITGESVPVSKGEDDEVIGGAINKNGSLEIKVTHVGSDSYLSQVVKLVEDSQDKKSNAQGLADRAAALLFYVALGVGIITFIVWLFITKDLATAVERAVTVMIIACPHALGLAVPLVVARSTAIAAKNGLLIKNRTQFETARNIDAILFDKTGTLTEGEFGVEEVISYGDYSKTNILEVVSALERNSEHPIAEAIVNYSKDYKLNKLEAENFQALTGIGIEGDVNNNHYKIVSPSYLKENDIEVDTKTLNDLSNKGMTVVALIKDNIVEGLIALMDQIRESAKDTIQALNDSDIESVMLTGDNKNTANYIAQILGMDTVISEVKPEEKSEQVNKVQNQNKIVAMTGDGINDSPALAEADVGIAIGSGTDVAFETSDIVLVKSNPKDVLNLVKLSKKTYNKMLQNLWWAAGYNIIALPLAAGVLAPIGIILSPAVGAILMSLSTVIVAINAQTLKLSNK